MGKIEKIIFKEEQIGKVNINLLDYHPFIKDREDLYILESSVYDKKNKTVNGTYSLTYIGSFPDFDW